MMGYTVSAVQISANRRTAFLLAQALMLNFRELRYGEVRRIPLLRTRVNKGKKKPGCGGPGPSPGRCVVWLLGRRRGDLPPRAWGALGRAHKQRGRRVHV
jgi:hypothetical protein